jgi:hypothetical protein
MYANPVITPKTLNKVPPTIMSKQKQQVETRGTFLKKNFFVKQKNVRSTDKTILKKLKVLDTPLDI